MAKKQTKTIPEDKRKFYEQLVASVPGIEVNETFGFPYTSLNGHMYSLLSKSGFVGIRLPKKERGEFLETYQSTLYKPEPGPLLKEYVTIPNDLLEDTNTLKKYLEKGLEYVKGLKPKPGKGD